MGYQSMPWQNGSSNSFDKLTSLSLPALKGKRVLDVGCNTGYFCGWAAFQGAAYVRGIDKDPTFIAQAKAWFPDCSFGCMDWNQLGPEQYDLILCLSAIHYADDQQAMIDELMRRLAPEGLLVLEIGIAPGDADEFVSVTRAITAEISDPRLFPTMRKMESLLAAYSFKYMGGSVMQAGDPTPRHVFHVQRRKPLAVLLMDGHYAGKSSVVKAIIKPDIVKLYGEFLYHRIADGEIRVSPELKSLMRYEDGTRHMIPPRITRDVCSKGLLPELAAVWMELAGKNDFVLEHYMPDEYRLDLARIFDQAGYFVVDIATLAAHNRPWTVQRLPYKRYLAYTEHLERISEINEADYLAANPDVAAAVRDGTMPSGQHHYRIFGRREKRKLKP